MNKDNILIVDNDVSKEINMFNNDIECMSIVVKDRAKLVLNYFKDVMDNNIRMDIEVGNGSSFVLNHSYVNKNDYELDVNVRYNGEGSSVLINIYGINDSGKSVLNVDGSLCSNNINNVLDEKIKVININDGKVVCKPNMYIKISKIIANHQNTISNVSEDELFYLMSKGISRENSERLVINGFITSIISNNELREEVKSYLDREV